MNIPNPLNKTSISFLLFFFTVVVIKSQSYNVRLTNRIDSDIFDPVKIYLKNDSIKEGFGLIPYPFSDQVLFVEEKAG
ncbi:hypothetical protein [Mangrovivirga cuniculi]|uniref:Uncharacterized protein n=1 Tax=Mangrovivirga cuniculi TaxID=2715131 RepID=A0A4D7K9Z3_9BACT|nr:hypothetical protein [Mangrovivirga cuniculi]QCK16158.1 hypothetical protein DCC35_16120 [Mangrovivirga cuniculi]